MTIEFPKINQKEWCKLYQQGVIDAEEYKLDSRFKCNKILNQVVQEDMFLKRILFHDVGYIPQVLPLVGRTHNRKLYKRKTIKDLELGELPRLDHYQVIQFDQNWSNIDGIDCFKGVFNFPYHDVEDIVDIFELDHGDLWEAFIINPRFLRYNSSCAGVFYTLKVDYIDELVYSLNGYFTKLTGYPLLFKPTWDDIEEINCIEDLDLSRKSFCEAFTPDHIDNDDNIMFYKLLKFWAENECVEVQEFNHPYKLYSDNIICSLWINFNLKRISSSIPFEFVHIETGDILGPFTDFEYDPAYNCYDSDGKTYPIDFFIKESFKKGLYDIRLCE